MTFSHEHSGVEPGRYDDIKASVNTYTEKLREVVEEGGYEPPEASLNLPDDKKMLSSIRTIADEKTAEGELHYVILVGIGGSNLGAMAAYEAIVGTLDAHIGDRLPKIIFADTVSPTLIAQVERIVESMDDPREILVNVVSKSGGTTETVAHFEVLYRLFSKKFGDAAADRFVLTTDSGSKLWNVGEAHGMSTLSVPEKVGGRFSVFSPVGLFPLFLAGVDVEDFLAGAKAMRDRCLGDDNIALASAALTFAHYEDDIKINNSFFFNPELESVGKWYRQLMGESIGKEKDLEGNVVRAGITPIVSIGSADLHSMAQLYFGGPKDKFTSFIFAPQEKNGLDLPKETEFDLVDGISGKSYAQIMDAIIKGVKAAYRNNNLPYVDVGLEDASESSVGQFMQFKMIEMMYLAKLMNVNAFDQPNVEDYKKETKKILTK